MKTLTIGNNTYEIVDEAARSDIDILKQGAITTDTTLTQEGKAADAKATGDAISAIPRVEVGDTQPTNEGVELWIDTTEGTEVIDIPEINDDEISTVDTWSSKKINDNDVYSGVTPPVSVFENKIWVDTSVQPAVIKRYNGTEWEAISSDASQSAALMYTEIEDLTAII